MFEEDLRVMAPKVIIIESTMTSKSIEGGEPYAKRREGTKHG